MRVARGYRALMMLVLAIAVIPVGRAENRYQEHWYRATLNHVDTHLWVLVLTRSNARYVRKLDLATLGLPVPRAHHILHASEVYYRAASLQDVSIYVDKRDRRVFFVDHQRPEVAKPPSRDLLLTVTIDGRRLDQPQYLHYAHGQLLLPAETLKALRIQPSPEWQPPVPLHRLAGEFFTLDYHKLALSVTVPPRLLKKSLLDIPRQPIPLASEVAPSEGGQPVPVISGSHGLSAIFSYDVAGGYNSASDNWTSGIYRAALGDDTTTCRTAFLDSTNQARLRRLDSQCSFDWPKQMVSLSVGDAIGGGNVVAQPVRYGGIRIGTDFGLQPDFITLPVSRISGTARVPSTLEVWVDQMLALRSKIPAGPFEVQNIPLHTGAGELKATIISPTGARHVITSPFYADSSLLAAGLSDWSVNLGKLRTGFATPDDQYADAFAAANVRHGFASGFTGMLGFQATGDFKLASAGAALRLGSWAVVDLAAGYSANRFGGNGSALRGRFTHQGPHFTLSYQWQRNSRGYQELAWPVPGTAPETTRQLSVGMPIAGGASFNVSDYDQRYFDGTTLQFTSASLNIGLGDWGNLLLSGFHLTRGGSPWIYAAQLTIPFGQRSNVSAWSQTDNGMQSERIGLQMNPPAGPGFGYRLGLGRTGSRRTGLADLELQGDIAQLDLGASQYGDTRTATARLAGSVLLSGNGLGLSRRQPGSYAVVHVGVPDIPVYRDGQLVAYSGSDGDAVVAGMRPYDDNVIAIHPEDVPLNVQPRALKAVLTPGRREIMSAAFDFEPIHYVTGQLRISHVKFVPRGATLQISGAAAKTVVGNDGRFFVKSPAGHKFMIQASWDGNSCDAVAKPKPIKAADAVTELGILNCKVASQ